MSSQIATAKRTRAPRAQGLEETERDLRVMTKTEQYRAKASECDQLAKQAKDPHAAEIYR
jgi:hypothetical protein